MIMSQKSQYAVRAVLELAKREGAGPVKAAKIAAAQHIPLRFLGNILAQLRQAGIVESVRGKEGGYVLGQRAEDISVGEILRVVQGPLYAVECLDVKSGRECPLRPGCVLLPVWESAYNAMMDVFDGTTFQELLERELAACEAEAFNYAI